MEIKDISIDNLIFLFKNLDICKNQIKEFREKTNIKLSYYDRKQQDLLHMLEFNKLNACQLSKIMKELKKVRRERRSTKNLHEMLQNPNVSFSNIEAMFYKRTKNCTYQYKVYTKTEVSAILNEGV